MKVKRIVLFLLLACCARKPAEPVERRVVVTANGATPAGQLIIWWMLPDEVTVKGASWDFNSFLAARKLLDRAMPFAGVDFAKTPQHVVTVKAPKEARVFALLDTDHNAFNCLLEGAAGGDFTAHSPGTELVLAEVPPKPPRAETCAGDRTVLEHVEAPEVAGTIGNETTRRLCVHLPAAYAKEPERRWPVAYALPGFSGEDSGGSIRAVFKAVDELPEEQQFIVVGVNITAKLGTSYLTKSALAGDFETYLAETVPKFIDAKYRTRGPRALLGQSTGGFDAVSMTLRHPEVFSVLAETSADGLDLGKWMLAEDGKRLAPFPHACLKLEAAVGPPGQMTAYAVAWSDDASAPGGFRWAADPQTGKLNEAVWKRWLANSPSELIKKPAVLAAVKKELSGRIWLGVGRRDDFDLYLPAVAFSEQLKAAGVEHELYVDDGDHGGPPERKKKMVAFLAEKMKAPIDAPR